MGIGSLGQQSEHEYTQFSVLKTCDWKYSRFRKFLSEWKRQNKELLRQNLQLTQMAHSTFHGPAVIMSMGESLNSVDKRVFMKARRNGALFAINATPLTLIGSEFQPNFVVLNDEPFWTPRTQYENDLREGILAHLHQNTKCTVIQPAHLENFSKFNKTIHFHGNPLTSFTKNINITKAMGIPNSTIFFAVASALYLGFSPIIIAGHDFDFAKKTSFVDGNYYTKRINPISGQESLQPLIELRENLTNLYASTALHIHYWNLFQHATVITLSQNGVIDTVDIVSNHDALQLLSQEYF